MINKNSWVHEVWCEGKTVVPEETPLGERREPTPPTNITRCARQKWRYFKQEPVQRGVFFLLWILYYGWPNQPSSGTITVNGCLPLMLSIASVQCYGRENTTLESNFVCLMRLFVMTFSLYDKVSYWPTLLLTSTITEEGLREPGGKPWIRIRKRMVKLQLDESASTSLNRKKKIIIQLVGP